VSRLRRRFHPGGFPAFALAIALGLLTVGGPALMLTVAATADTPTVFETRIAARSDDAEEQASGSVSLTTPDLELGVDKVAQTVGLRFSGIPVPKGATITASWIQFEVDQRKTGATSLTIRGQAADNAASFATTSRNISSRAVTTASVAWSPPAWTTVHERGPAQRTPNLSGIVQQIVNRVGWAPGNAMAFLVTGSGTRTAEAYEGSGAASFHVEYTTGSPTTTTPHPPRPRRPRRTRS
jgi:hypothetical protein